MVGARHDLSCAFLNPHCSLFVPCCWQRSQRKVAGVRLIDHDTSHLVYDVEMESVTGKFRASIMVARKLLAEETLRMWSDEEIAFLFFMSSGVPDCYRVKKGTTWAMCAHLLSNEHIAAKLQGMTGFRHDHRQLALAIQAIRRACKTSTSHSRTRFVHGSLVWLLENTIEEAGVAGSGHERGQDCAAEVSALLRDTTVQREALSKSSRTFDRAESFLVARNGKRTRIANSCITKVQKENIPLMRHEFCRMVLQLPPVMMIHGHEDTDDAYYVYETRRERKSGSAKIMPSVESGPGDPSSAKSAAWEALAREVESRVYGGDPKKPIGKLREVQLSAGDLRLLLALRVGRRVVAVDVQPIVRKNVEWLLSILDESCWDVWRVDQEINSICHNAVIIQMLCKAEKQREHADVTYATDQLAEMRASSVAAGPAALLGPCCHGSHQRVPLQVSLVTFAAVHKVQEV